MTYRCWRCFSSRYRFFGCRLLAPSLFLAEAGVNSGCVTSPSLLDCPADTAQMVDHLIQRILVSLGKALGDDVPRIVGVRVIVGGWSNSAERYPSGSEVLRSRRRVRGVREERHPSRFGCGPEIYLLPKADGAMVFLREGDSENDGVA